MLKHKINEALSLNNHTKLAFQRFVQYLASSNTSFQLSNFLDKGGVQGRIRICINNALTYHYEDQYNGSSVL